MMKLFVLCSSLILIYMSWSCEAMTEDQKAMIHAHFEKLGMECFQTVPIDEEDIMNLKDKKIPTGPNVPCFMACIMKKIGAIDESGKLQKETALELAKKVFKEQEEIDNIREFLHSCNAVNDVAVSDNEKGCERAMLAFKCMIENSSKFGFDL